MDFGEPERADEGVGVLDHSVHRVIVVRRIVGVTLSELVERDDVEVPGQRVEVPVPDDGARRRLVGAEIAAIDEYERRAGARLEVARAHPVDIGPFGIGHRHGHVSLVIPVRKFIGMPAPALVPAVGIGIG